MNIHEERTVRVMAVVVQNMSVMNGYLVNAYNAIVLYNDNKNTLDPFLYEKCHDMFVAAIESFSKVITDHADLIRRCNEYLDGIDP